MAEEVVNKIVAAFKIEENILYDQSTTEHLPISGGDVGGSEKFLNYKKEKNLEGESLGLKQDSAEELVDQYGSNVEKVYELYNTNLKIAQENNLDLVVLAKLIYSIEYELAYTPKDFFIRRTSAMFFDIAWVERHRTSVIQYMAISLNWSESEKERYKTELIHAIQEAKLTEIR